MHDYTHNVCIACTAACQFLSGKKKKKEKKKKREKKRRKRNKQEKTKQNNNNNTLFSPFGWKRGGEGVTTQILFESS